MSSSGATEQSWPACQRIVLSCDQQSFNVKDILDWAWLRGDLNWPWQSLQTKLARQKQAEHLNQEADPEALQTMSEEFRYQKDLLSAEETEKWLAQHDLTEEDFAEYFARSYWAGATELEFENPEPIAFPDSTPELLELLRIDLVMSGGLDALAEALCWRVAAWKHQPALSSPSAALELERRRLEERTGLPEPLLARELGKLGRDATWLETWLRLESAFNTLSADWLNQDERVRALKSRRHGLTRVQVESFLAPNMDAAREAVLCLRENQGTIEELAGACGSAHQTRELFLEDLGSDLQQRFLCASAGEVFNLPENESGWLVCRVLGKFEPDLADSNVRSRIDQRLLQTRFAELTRRCVRVGHAPA